MFQWSYAVKERLTSALMRPRSAGDRRPDATPMRYRGARHRVEDKIADALSGIRWLRLVLGIPVPLDVPSGRAVPFKIACQPSQIAFRRGKAARKQVGKVVRRRGRSRGLT